GAGPFVCSGSGGLSCALCASQEICTGRPLARSSGVGLRADLLIPRRRRTGERGTEAWAFVWVPTGDRSRPSVVAESGDLHADAAGAELCRRTAYRFPDPGTGRAPARQRRPHRRGGRPRPNYAKWPSTHFQLSTALAKGSIEALSTSTMTQPSQSVGSSARAPAMSMPPSPGSRNSPRSEVVV
ncbi:MAG: hypothetical protein JWP75_3962, partial [Frondihabitans sp.]|nr:hypothetical protein [Frondihabitans sp.]